MFNIFNFYNYIFLKKSTIQLNWTEVSSIWIRPLPAEELRERTWGRVEFLGSAAHTRGRLPAGRTWDAVRPAWIFFCLLWIQCAAFSGEIRGVRCVLWVGDQKEKKEPGITLQKATLGKRSVSCWTLVQQLAILFFFLW